jgi:LPXTG-motif cell wall-anchored protein
MQYQYRTMRGSGSSPRTGVKAPPENAIIAVLCIIALIGVAFIFPTSLANADNPDTSTPSPSVFPVMPPSYCGDGTVTVLSSTGSVYLVGVGKNSIAQGREQDAGSDGTKEIGAKCIIPGPFLPADRSSRKIPDSSVSNRPATYDALGSNEDGTLWAVLNQTTDDSSNPTERYIAIYRAKPGVNDGQWTQMGGIGRKDSSGHFITPPFQNNYWGYSKKQPQLSDLGQVVGGGVNPTNGRFYFMSTQNTRNGSSYSNVVNIWVTPEDCSQDSCLPSKVGSINVGDSDTAYSGGDLTFTHNGDLVLDVSNPGKENTTTKPHTWVITAKTGIISADELTYADGNTLEWQNVTTTSSTSSMRTPGGEPRTITGLAMSYTKDGTSYPVVSRLAQVDENMNNLYDFSGYQLSRDSLSPSFKQSIVYAFPLGPAYSQYTDAHGDTRYAVDPTIWEPGTYSYNRTPVFWDQHYSDIADGVYIPPATSLTINKVDNTDSTHKLNGAVFKVWQRAGVDTGCHVTPPDNAQKTSATDRNGSVTLNHLAYGTYCVKETTAPDGYKLNDDPQTAVISAATPNVTLTFEDEQLVGTITVKKTDASSGAALAGATFVLYVDANNDGKVNSGDTKYPNDTEATKKTDSNGQAEWTNIPIGNYVLQETKAPEGYVTPSESESDHEVKMAKDDVEKGIVVKVTNKVAFTAQLPLTGGTSTDVFVISSVALIVIAGGLYGLYVVRRRRQSLR